MTPATSIESCMFSGREVSDTRSTISRPPVHDYDILHACRNPTRIFDLDDLTMLIAAATDGHLLEIGVVEGDGIDFIVNALIARNKFLR